MQEQHLDERTRPGAVTETAAGTLPVAFVRGGEATVERACASALEPGSAPGLRDSTSR